MAESKVILTQTVANLGHSGDVVAVRSGYARNYLIPQASPSRGPSAEAQIVQMKRARLAKAVATRRMPSPPRPPSRHYRRDRCQVSESGKLFGSVTAEQIALALSDKAAVNPKAIEVEPIKTTGDFPLRPPCTRRSPLPSS